MDESLWPSNPNPNARASDTNLYMGSSTDEDYEEAIDQFSPTLYTRSAAAAAIPIPTSAGNSPQHQLHPHQPRIAQGLNSAAAAAAFSASPSIYAYPHSPFYASSPETSTLSSPLQVSGMQGHPAHSSRISFSYDPAFQRLHVPKRRSPLECATVFAAVAAAATCGGDPQQMGMATPVNRSVLRPSFSLVVACFYPTIFNPCLFLSMFGVLTACCCPCVCCTLNVSNRFYKVKLKRR